MEYFPTETKKGAFLKPLFILFISITFTYSKNLPVYFKHNKHISNDKLYNALNLTKPSFYEFWKKDPTVDIKILPFIKNRLQNFYKTQGFYHATIKDKITKDKIYLIINEGKPITIKSITVLSDYNLSKLIPFKKDKIFSNSAFEESKNKIKAFYEKRGYCKADIDTKAWIDIVKDEAYLTYDIKSNKPCRFGKIDIVSPKLNKQIIKSFLHFKKNEPYSLNKIKKTYTELYLNEGVSNVFIKTDKTNDYKVDTTVNVEVTNKPLRFQTGFGINSDNGLEAQLGIKDRNFLNNLKTLSFFTTYTALEKSASLDFGMPLVKKRFLGAILKYSDEEYPGFKQKKITQNIFLKQRFDKLTLQGGVIVDNSKIYDSKDIKDYNEGDFTLSSLKFGLVYDTRDDMLEPTNGYFVKTDISSALKGLSSDGSYYKYDIQGGYIIPFLPYIVALKAHYGSLRVLSGDIPASYRFFAGGMNSNRAYSYRDLGDKSKSGDPIGFNSIFEMSAEYRFPLYKNFGGILFSDNTYIGMSEVPDFKKCYNSFGFGIRYKTPIGPIALDLGFDAKHPSKQYAFHFRIGEAF